MNITREFLEQQADAFRSCRSNRIAKNAVINVGLSKAAAREEAVRSSRHVYSIHLKQGKATNQKSSGRCWMFAALNVMRFDLIQKLNLKDFELSQAYPFFYDKLEKANYFLETILSTLEEETDSRLMAHLLSAPVQDGGQWDMFANLVRKYGVVPKDAMPETISCTASAEMRNLLTELLRSDACLLRKAHQAGATPQELALQKEELLKEVYRLLCICLGEPPKRFDFEVMDKNGVLIRDWQLTPQEFYEKYIGQNMDDYVSLINAPTRDKPYYRSYSVKHLGNVIEGAPVRYLNLPSEELKKAAIAQLKDGAPVWFGCDVGKSSNRESGVMDLTLYDYEELFQITLGMSKAERLEYGQSQMTHAMVFMGVDLDDEGRPLRWRVENSWGGDRGRDGYFVMSDAWFDEYNYQVVVNRKYLPQSYLAQYEQEPILLEPWDPMGSLAE